MNLVIDVGNTFSKIAVFQNDSIVDLEKVTFEELFFTVQKKIEKFPIKASILFSVNHDAEELSAFLKEKTCFVKMANDLKLPFSNNYGTPNTLGQDRIALAAQAAHSFPFQNLLIIDAGTCITYDFLDDQKKYLGGGISPGLRMRFEALHNFTAKLPVIIAEEIDFIIGSNTSESMLSGVVNGIVYEIDGFITEYSKNYKDLTVILTGGDAQFLSKRLKNGIFANSNFLLEGLNTILELNKTND
ncbi:type III pantothenate kinase [Pustulibacterium marinum]|uniref:Type III pantothenate kinase n=1 Tax=Pustulibacterium marinum TaxID=1224947 RepID=A0A1I7EUU1_9FLAO|nr:type III pantothenate kinase [Pustulibacterium marinum]SFU27696.1 type III pantothenate kinase [Pustulibacterium marinum]